VTIASWLFAAVKLVTNVNDPGIGGVGNGAKLGDNI
jgi:hypothetical protein